MMSLPLTANMIGNLIIRHGATRASTWTPEGWLIAKSANAKYAFEVQFKDEDAKTLFLLKYS